jgi:hypothetical protein
MRVKVLLGCEHLRSVTADCLGCHREALPRVVKSCRKLGRGLSPEDVEVRAEEQWSGLQTKLYICSQALSKAERGAYPPNRQARPTNENPRV